MENDDDEWEICWHVSPSVNRESIERHGLDWRRMGATGGIARGTTSKDPRPEMEGVFLCESLASVDFFVGFGSHPAVDVWEVDARGLPVEYPDDSWPFVRVPIARSRLRLLRKGILPP
jgi:hypothetical protein